jgi:hypothetical protein
MKVDFFLCQKYSFSPLYQAGVLSKLNCLADCLHVVRCTMAG